ncbi:MAG: hypothetical protein K6A81_11755, partial [Clostridiales bacterium]|nr:hypothetical protein [Clostridiales bacterium]
MRTNQTIRRIFSILITLGMLLTFLPFTKQAIADGERQPDAWCIFVNEHSDILIQENADDPGNGYHFAAIYIDGSNGYDVPFNASGIDPNTELIINNAEVENASIYQDFTLLGGSRIYYEGGNANTYSESNKTFEGYYPDDIYQTMSDVLGFIGTYYENEIEPMLVTTITDDQTISAPMDFQRLIINEGGSLTVTSIEGSGFDNITIRIHHDLTLNGGDLDLNPSSDIPVGLEIMDNASFVVAEDGDSVFGIADGSFLNLHNRVDNDFINLDPGYYVYENDEWVDQQGQRNDGIYIGSDPAELINGISFSATPNGSNEPITGSDEQGFIAKGNYENADEIIIEIDSDLPLMIEIYDGSDPEHREPLDPSLYDLNGSILTIYKGEGEGADWFSVYDIWLKTEGIYFNYDHDHAPISNIAYWQGETPIAVTDNYITKSVYENADSITFTFDISDPERDITIDVRDENDQRIDVEGIYTYANGELTINKTESEWRPMYNICIGVDHSQDPREDGISIGWDESTMVRKAVYEVKSGDNVLSSGDVDQEFIPKDQYDLDSADSIVITFDSDKSLVIEVFDDADPRHRLDQSHYAINGNTLTIFRGRGQGQEDQWFSSYEIW